MVLSQVGAALAVARIGVTLFEVGVARATPKAYKSPPLGQWCLIGCLPGFVQAQGMAEQAYDHVNRFTYTWAS